MNQTEPDFTKIDDDKIANYYVNWGKAMESAKRQMYDSQEMLKEIEKDYLSTNSQTESNLGISFTQKTLEMFNDENTKIDILSWRQYIKNVYLPNKKAAINS